MSDFMPEEVVIQILTRLPPKSLLRFRCVSKSWKSLISSPQFVNKQTRRSFLSKPPSPPPRVLLRYHSKDQHSEVYSVHHNNETFGVDNDVKELLPFLAPKNIVIATPGIKRYYLRIVGSSNGLLCLSDDMLTQTDVIILWNPSIRRKITLPLPRRSMGPWGLLCAIGFGYDIKNNDFKVVRIAYVEDKKDGKDGYVLPPIVEIFSPSVGNWREIGGNVPRAWVIEYFRGQAFVNGKLHWTAYRRKSAGRVGERENLILVFDLSDEVFQEMPLPNVLLNESPINMETAVYEESISVLHYDARVQSRHCSIWVMKQYGNADSWIKMFHVDVGGLGLVLGFRKTGDILLALECGELVSYDPKTRGTDSLGIFGSKCSFCTDAYTESLALLSEGQQEVADLRNASKSGCSDVNIEEEVDDKVELSELWKQAIMIKYLNALLERQFT